MRIYKRIKNIRSVGRFFRNNHRISAVCIGAALIAGGLSIAYSFDKVEDSVMTYVPVMTQEKPVIVLDAGHGGYVLNRVAGAIWFLTLKSFERRGCVVQSLFTIF